MHHVRSIEQFRSQSTQNTALLILSFVTSVYVNCGFKERILKGASAYWNAQILGPIFTGPQAMYVLAHIFLLDQVKLKTSQPADAPDFEGFPLKFLAAATCMELFSPLHKKDSLT